MKKRMMTSFAGIIVLASLVLAGCEDKKAIQALTEMTTGLSETVKGHQATIQALMTELDGCRTNIVKRGGKAPTESVEEAKTEAPNLGENPKLADLETYKKNLQDFIQVQEAKIDDLKNKVTSCAADLSALKKKAAAAKTSTTTGKTKKTPAEATSIKEKKAIEEGTSTTGVRSRRKNRPRP